VTTKFRQTFIAALVVTALGVALAGWCSCFAYQCLVVRVGPRHWLIPHMGDGLVRLFWMESSDENAEVLPRLHNRYLGFLIADAKSKRDPALFRLTTDRGVRIASRGQVPAFGFQWRLPWPSGAPSGVVFRLSLVRVPLWVPVVLLLIYPAAAFLLGPVRRRLRRNRNQCLECGYALVALSEPRCPECGKGFDIAAVSAERI